MKQPATTRQECVAFRSSNSAVASQGHVLVRYSSRHQLSPGSLGRINLHRTACCNPVLWTTMATIVSCQCQVEVCRTCVCVCARWRQPASGCARAWVRRSTAWLCRCKCSRNLTHLLWSLRRSVPETHVFQSKHVHMVPLHSKWPMLCCVLCLCCSCC